VIAGSGDNAAAARGRDDGRFRVSRGDREQVIELLKTAFVDERLTTEELDARVGQALTSRTRADLSAVTADIAVGPNVSQPPREAARAHGQPSTRYVARHAKANTAKASTAKASTGRASTAKVSTAKVSPAKASTARATRARMGVAVVVAVKVMLVLSFVTSIPPLFLLLVLCCVTVVIATVARMLSSSSPPED
jgi:hypothetical protein